MIEYILSFFLMLLISAFAIHPFLQARAKDELFAENDTESERLALLYEKRNLYQLSLRDIELDRDMGKLDKQDYAKLSEKYRKKAKEIVQDISELEDRNADSSSEKKLQTTSAFQTPNE